MDKKATTEKGEEKQWGKGEWQTYKQEHHDTKVKPKFNHPKPPKPASIASELIAIASELVDKDGNPVQAADHDKAHLMIKHADMVAKSITEKAKSITMEIEHAKKSIEGLEKLGSAAIEAPKFLKAIQAKITSLQDFLDEVSKEIDKTI